MLTYVIESFLFIFTVVYEHLSLPVAHDDIIRSQSEFKNFFEIIKYYWNYNGRITTDSLAEVWAHHRNVWVVVDCLAYFALIILILKIFEKFSPAFLGLTYLLVLIFPFHYWESAGYVSTTTNYLYSTVCFLGIIACTKNLENEGKKFLKCFLTMLCIGYIAFSNQFIIGTVLFLLYLIVYQLWANKKTVKQILMYIWLELFVIFMFGVMWFSPGYQARMNGTDEMMYWLPQYQKWSLMKKIVEGYTTTVANIVYKDNSFLIILCIAVLLLGIYSQKNLIIKIISAVPALCIALLKIKGYSNFIIYYKYAGTKPDIKVNIDSLKSIVALTVPIIIFCAVIVSLFFLIIDTWTRYLVICLLIIGAISREMMGFTATIYASDFRTFTLFFFCIIITILCVVNELLKNKKDNLAVTIEMLALICWLM